MAYVDWLNDVGRVFLIMFTGFVFFGIAYFSEKKNILVFSNVFYSLSIFIVYYSLILAHFSFSLVNGHILSYLVLLLMASVFTYFRNKRYEFLDTLLFLFYFIAGTSMIFYFDISGKVSSYFEIILFVTALGYISFVYLKNYYENNDVKRKKERKPKKPKISQMDEPLKIFGENSIPRRSVIEVIDVEMSKDIAMDIGQQHGVAFGQNGDATRVPGPHDDGGT